MVVTHSSYEIERVVHEEVVEIVETLETLGTVGTVGNVEFVKFDLSHVYYRRSRKREGEV